MMVAAEDNTRNAARLSALSDRTGGIIVANGIAIGTGVGLSYLGCWLVKKWGASCEDWYKSFLGTDQQASPTETLSNESAWMNTGREVDNEFLANLEEVKKTIEKAPPPVKTQLKIDAQRSREAASSGANML